MLLNSSLKRGLTAASGAALFLTALALSSPAKLWNELSAIPGELVVVLTVLCTINLMAVAFRFWRVLSLCGLSVPWSMVVRACFAGNLASLAFIPLLAQVAGRQAILNKIGVSPMTTASVSALERVMLAGLSAGAAAVGAGYLLGAEAAMTFVTSLAFPQIAAVLGFAGLISFLMTRSTYESGLIGQVTTRYAARAGSETLFTTVVGHALMVCAFMVAFNWAAPALSYPELLASAVVVSFAASMPLSVGGWGVREVSSVFVLGHLGVGAATAMAASVLVGVCSTFAVLLTSTLLLKEPGSRLPNAQSHASSVRSLHLDKIASWLLGMTTTALVFFQVHVSLGGNTVNVNLGDPFATLALAAVALTAINSRKAPLWTMRGFNSLLLLFTAALLLAFVVGVIQIGVTPWALGNKLTGWLVLLGYLSAGYLLSSHHMNLGVQRMLEVALIVACTVVIVKILVRATPWFEGQFALEPANFEGFSGNRNAFAFQLTAVLAVAIGYLKLYARLAAGRKWMYTGIKVGIAVLLLGIVLSGSRTGMIVASLVLVIALAALPETRRSVAAAITLAAISWSVLTQSAMVYEALSTAVRSSLGSEIVDRLPVTASTAINLQSNISSESSDGLRWRANAVGMQMWGESPLVGGGLGSFIHHSNAVFGQSVTIHSSPVWLLAEFGALGLAVIAWATFIALRHFRGRRWSNAKFASVALLLMSFVLFSLMHEMIYQRILWLFLGALLAQQVGRDPQSNHAGLVLRQ